MDFSRKKIIFKGKEVKMCRKVVYMACVAAMLSMAMQVLAANDWTNTTGDGK